MSRHCTRPQQLLQPTCNQRWYCEQLNHIIGNCVCEKAVITPPTSSLSLLGSLCGGQYRPKSMANLADSCPRFR